MWQPLHLHDNKVFLRPLREEDFEILYAVASDPLIWEQHPNPDRYKREVFENYFRGALESNGALLISDVVTGEVVGCSRFYDHEPENDVVKIGYTFFGRSAWGKGYNQAAKKLMLDHAFSYVSKVIFHVGEKNMRSRIAMTRLGAELMGMEEVAYYGEASRMNCVFLIRKPDPGSSPIV